MRDPYQILHVKLGTSIEELNEAYLAAKLSVNSAKNQYTPEERKQMEAEIDWAYDQITNSNTYTRVTSQSAQNSQKTQSSYQAGAYGDWTSSARAYQQNGYNGNNQQQTQSSSYQQSNGAYRATEQYDMCGQPVGQDRRNPYANAGVDCCCVPCGILGSCCGASGTSCCGTLCRLFILDSICEMCGGDLCSCM